MATGQCDVAVIGAGIHGASIAFHLASRGIRVAVFERGTPAGGPTGRSSAVCRAYYTNEFLAEVARDSLEILRNFSDVTAGRTCDYRETGVLFLHDSGDVEDVRSAASRLGALGISVELLTPEALANDLPAFDLDGVAVGAWEARAGYADPAGATIGFLQRAQELGAVTRFGAEIMTIDAAEGGGATVALKDGGRISCARLVIAAGPWTAALARQVGVHLPLTVERHIVVTAGWGVAEPIPFAFVDIPRGYYGKPEGEHLLCLGGLHEGSQVDPDHFFEGVTADEDVELLSAAARRVPSLVEAQPQGGWASLYDVSPDWQPVVGEIADGIFVDAGTSGHGFKLAAALGRHIADLVSGETVDGRLRAFHPDRFAAGASIAGGYGQARILG